MCHEEGNHWLSMNTAVDNNSRDRVYLAAVTTRCDRTSNQNPVGFQSKTDTTVGVLIQEICQFRQSVNLGDSTTQMYLSGAASGPGQSQTLTQAGQRMDGEQP